MRHPTLAHQPCVGAIDSIATTTRLRPVRLAAWSAASAERTSVSASLHRVRGAAYTETGRGEWLLWLGKARRAPDPQLQMAQLARSPAPRLLAPQPFRPIQYLGSKLRLLPEILAAVGDVAGGRTGHVCDLFSGSGVVSHALGAEAPVVAVDVQEYSRVLAAGLLRGASSQSLLECLAPGARRSASHAALEEAISPLATVEAACLEEAAAGDPARLDELIEHASLQRFAAGAASPPSWLAAPLSAAHRRLTERSPELRAGSQLTRLYGGSYFSFSQSIALDVLRRAIAALPPPAHDVALGALLSTASAVVNTVGKQFAQPIRLRKKDGSYRRILVERTLADRRGDVFAIYDDWLARWRSAVAPTPHDHRAVRSDYADFLSTWSEPIRAVYADPPYTIDHYSRFYHVLETLCLYDEPRLATMRKGGVPTVMRGLYRTERRQSPFCIPSAVEGAFEALFRGVAHQGAPLVLSYSPDRGDGTQRPRLLDLGSLTRMARRWFSRVETLALADHAHRKLNADPSNLDSLPDAEVLLRCWS